MKYALSLKVILILALAWVSEGCSKRASEQGESAPTAPAANGVAIPTGTGNATAANAAAQVPPPEQVQKLAQKFGGRIEMLTTGRPEWHLDLASSKITDADLAILELPSEIVSVNLSHTAITDKGLENLKSRAPHVERLDLMGTKITDQGLLHLRSMPSLWSVSVEGTTISVEGHKALMEFMQPRIDAYLARQSGPQP